MAKSPNTSEQLGRTLGSCASTVRVSRTMPKPLPPLVLRGYPQHCLDNDINNEPNPRQKEIAKTPL